MDDVITEVLEDKLYLSPLKPTQDLRKFMMLMRISEQTMNFGEFFQIRLIRKAYR